MIELRDTVTINIAPVVLGIRYRAFPVVSGGVLCPRGQPWSGLHSRDHHRHAVPIIGPAMDQLLCWALGRRIEAIGRHPAEEGTNLKALLERGTAAGIP